MHNELKQHLLLIKFFLRRLKVDQELSIHASNNIFVFHQLLNLLKVACVTSHICGQDYSQKAYSEGLVFVFFESMQKVESFLFQNGERISGVHVLIDLTITVAYSKLRH